MSFQQTAQDFASEILSGRVPSGKWIYAAARRWQTDLARTDITMDWAAVGALDAHFRTLPLVGEDSGKPFELRPWQLWCLANLIGWRYADGRRRARLGILQVARGNGKTTLLAGLGLWDLLQSSGRRVHIIANNEDQAGICLYTAVQMSRALNHGGLDTRHDRVIRKDFDCEMTALPAKESSLDGLNPSLWIADEAAEFRGRALSKLLTTGSKRKESLGVIITTPGSNTENHYSELIKQAEAVLSGEVEDDSMIPMLFGIDSSDEPSDESCWPKANPGMAHGQPDTQSLRRSWNTMKRSPAARAEFVRYHCARTDENTGGWLDMSLWPQAQQIDWESLKKRPAWIGVDLSKSQDMTALTVAVPLDDGTVALQGHYWWPSDRVAERELDYRMPIRQWAAERKLTLTPGADIDYESVRTRLNELKEVFDIRQVAYDKWGAQYLANQLIADGLPLIIYGMNIGTFGPGCALFQNLWAGQKLRIGDDPVLRRSCAEAHAQTGVNGHVRPIKSRKYCIIDPLVASVLAIHVWGGTKASCYESEV